MDEIKRHGPLEARLWVQHNSKHVITPTIISMLAENDDLRARLAALTDAIGDPDELWQLALLLTAEGSPEMRRLKRIALAASDRRVYPSTADAAASLSPTPNPEGADMSGLPEQAVDALVLDHITQALGLVAQHGSVDDHPCGCRWNDLTGRWHLCRYHDGMNDGLAMAASPTPTPDHCPTCRGTWKIVRGQHPHYACFNVAWHDSQG